MSGFVYVALTFGAVGFSFFLFKKVFKIIWKIEDFTGLFWNILDWFIRVFLSISAISFCIFLVLLAYRIHIPESWFVI